MGAPSYEAASEVARLMKLFSHPFRLQIVNTLALEGVASATTLSARFDDVSLGDCNYHLRALQSGGAIALVKSRKVRGAEERIYRIEPLSRWPFNPRLLPIIRELVPEASQEPFEPVAITVSLALDQRGAADAASVISGARSKAVAIAAEARSRLEGAQGPTVARSAVLIIGSVDGGLT